MGGRCGLTAASRHGLAAQRTRVRWPVAEPAVVWRKIAAWHVVVPLLALFRSGIQLADGERILVVKRGHRPRAGVRLDALRTPRRPAGTCVGTADQRAGADWRDASGQD